ncbi:MAG: hypothetical protein ABI577_17490 [bacterium]
MSNWPPQYAPARTLAGKLQRGLGTGFLEALAAPPEVVHPLLLDCIRVDPRVDHQLDHRDVYYAELAQRVALPLTSVFEDLIDAASDEGEKTYLAVCVLVELARRGHEEADAALRDYVHWGPFWHSVCWQLGLLATTPKWLALVPALAVRAEQNPDEGSWDREPFPTWGRDEPRFKALAEEDRRRWGKRASPLAKPRGTTAKLLEPLTSGPATPIIAELARRGSPRDLELIEAATGSTFAMTRAIAISAQFERGDWRNWDAALDMALHDQNPPYATGIANRAILNAPADVLLPYARKWKSSPVFRRQHLAWSILKQYATPEFLPWIEARLERASASKPEARFDATSLAEMITNRFSGHPFPSLGRKFDAFTYSFGRRYLAEALAVTDPTFPTTRAFTSLWDCESSVRVIAAEHVSLEVPGSMERLREMAADPLEEDSRIRKVAERRLGTLTN